MADKLTVKLYNHSFKLLIFAVCVQVLLMLYFNNIKTDLFIDEYYTLNFSNANYAPLLKNHFSAFNTVLQWDFWQQLLSVQDGEQFNYASVYFNTGEDVHPPFYYFIVHTVYSCFLNNTSPLLAVIVNLMIFVVTQIVLYSLGSKVMQNNLWALVPCVMYGFSMGAISTFLLIRMYALLTFWCLLYIFVLYKYFIFPSKKLAICLGIINILGFLTHYYFIVFAAIAFFTYIIYFYKQKQYKALRQWGEINICSLLISIILFPKCLQHILGSGTNSYRGQQTIDIFLHFNDVQEALRYYHVIIVDNPVIFLALFLCFIYLAMLLLKKTNRVYFYNASNLQDKFVILCLIFTVVLLHLIMRLNPLHENRYFYLLYPVFSLLSVYYIKLFMSILKVPQRTVIILTIMFLLTQSTLMYQARAYIPRYTGNDKLPYIIEQWIKRENPHLLVINIKHENIESIVANLGLIKNMHATYVTENKNIEIDNNLLKDNIILCRYEKPMDKEPVEYFCTKYGYKVADRCKARIYSEEYYLLKRVH